MQYKNIDTIRTMTLAHTRNINRDLKHVLASLRSFLFLLCVMFCPLFAGEVGDWQNYFTEEENKHFDKLVEKHFKDLDWKFTYTL